jgi:hypothetical protein
MCKESVNVEELRKEVMADGVVTKEEVEMLWEKKDSQEGNTSSEFDALFAEAVMAWLLADGKIDEEEAQYLIDKINEDEDIDDAESELLEAINEWGSEEGHEVPSILVVEFPDYFEDDED